jgi:hypothetical protein
MPRGDTSKSTGNQQRQAAHIEEGDRARGVSEDEAERRAWATVNQSSDGGEKRGGSGYGKPKNKAAAKKAGRKGGRASAARTATERSASARKAARTRKRNQSRRRGRAASRT